MTPPKRKPKEVEFDAQKLLECRRMMDLAMKIGSDVTIAAKRTIALTDAPQEQLLLCLLAMLSMLQGCVQYSSNFNEDTAGKRATARRCAEVVLSMYSVGLK